MQKLFQKNLTGWLIFFYVLFIIVIPPLLNQFLSQPQNVFVIGYPPSLFILALSALCIFLLKEKAFIKAPEKSSALKKKKPFFIYSSALLLTFGLLCLISVFFEGAAFIFKIDSGIKSIVFPKNFIGFINFILGVISSAFLEEVIYRYYLPQAFKEIISLRFRINPKVSVLCEGAALLLFASGHLYLGILGFFNALVSGAVLRLCMIKTDSVLISFVSHAFFNFMSFLFLAFITT